ncbi:hypothetical protein AALP_AAs41566U000200 [Arabis alpina]|uniref:Uncharacterized protein n=1 Tax=Arabis alpina TaxID=50452 RepID=A0A087FWI2_ARAAL|nr:hypothetical protein AALP_AAs41566U000200 [Arabis alpina]
MVSVGSNLYVFGGRDAPRQYNGFYSFDTTTNVWKLLTPVEEGPALRSFHSMAADENNVYVFGGVGATARLKTLDSYNIVDHKWKHCSTPGDSMTARGGAGLEVVQGKKPSERSVFASAAVGKYIVIFGGEIAMDPLAHVGPGQLADGTFALDKLGEEEVSPNTKGWSASTTGTIDGKKGLLMLGGKAPTNDRFGDLFFYGVDSV